MSDAAKISAEAISALLTGLSSALTNAQLNMAEVPPTDAFGRSMPMYQIPELDFTFEIETVDASDATSSKYELRPAQQGLNSAISSTISGKIVAVPPNGGLPETRILVTQSSSTLDVQLVNTAGELLTNTLVEMEFDADASAALHNTTLTPARRLSLLENQQVTTDGDGMAKTKIKRSNLAVNQSAIVLVRAAGAETRVTITRES